MTTYGIGEYQMRDGKMARVERYDISEYFPLLGTVNGKFRTWARNGRYFLTSEHDFDLIAPWVEPTPVDEIAALKAENERLRNALSDINQQCLTKQEMYDKYGPQWTSQQGNEYEDTSSFLNFANELSEIAIEALKEQS